ncbi:MAG: lysophospholipid acyltransferase family protein [Kiritimatiellae bacterium]|jgi:1-acyl-sn-glycerol-3-phosphate acyltransferase|nr:lysophospholipid acyltransferase family protein [Kiritimatiellia bacterium]MDD4340807.1 lysophospholipid acyltransferase family protein [Kiritimatiellia bacterium]MDY0150511.1 lysophospholipid acyltransferase family protein [Kiritimatiellia bacterium]
MREGLIRQPLYWLTRGCVYLLLLLKYRLRVYGRDHVPATGGAVIAANHCSYLDPPVMAGANNRRIVRFLARDTLLSNPIAKWLFPRVGVIALDRTRGDLAALKKALAALKGGQVVGLFPEGTRSPDGQMRDAKGGIGFLIAKSKVPVVPLYISGTYQAFPKGAHQFRPSRLVARFGPAITPEEIRAAMPEKGGYEAVGALVMRRIRDLAEPEE